MRMKSNAYNLCLLRFGRESAKTNEQETIHSKEENRRIEINEEKHNRETRLQFRILVFQREVWIESNVFQMEWMKQPHLMGNIQISLLLRI